MKRCICSISGCSLLPRPAGFNHLPPPPTLVDPRRPGQPRAGDHSELRHHDRLCRLRLPVHLHCHRLLKRTTLPSTPLQEPTVLVSPPPPLSDDHPPRPRPHPRLLQLLQPSPALPCRARHASLPVDASRLHCGELSTSYNINT